MNTEKVKTILNELINALEDKVSQQLRGEYESQRKMLQKHGPKNKFEAYEFFYGLFVVNPDHMKKLMKSVEHKHVKDLTKEVEAKSRPTLSK